MMTVTDTLEAANEALPLLEMVVILRCHTSRPEYLTMESARRHRISEQHRPIYKRSS